MANVRVRWALPTTRTDGRPLPITQIGGTVVRLSSNGVDFVELERVLAPGAELLQTDLEPGTYQWEFEVFDTQTPPRSSAPLRETFALILAAPSAVAGVTFTVE